MKLSVLPVAAVFFLALAGCKPVPTTGSAAGPTPSAVRADPRLAAASGFDFYLLNLSWSPEFCHSHPDAAECGRRSTFVLHGLWPQNNDGSYPKQCGNAPGPSDPGQFSDIYPEPGLLEHEWKTHGVCTGLSANDFFGAARTAYRSVKIPAQLANLSAQTAMPPEQIAALFSESNPGISRESLAISCGNNYLTAVYVCMV